jgi:predicted nucleic acid-binding protein
MATPTLIDTDILIDAGRGVAEAINCLRDVQQNSALAVSVVTQMELIVGCRNKLELRKTEKFLQQFQVVKIDAAISDNAVDLLRKYRLSHGLLIADGFIAATAIVLGWPLITKNQKDYQFIQGLALLPYP